MIASKFLNIDSFNEKNKNFNVHCMSLKIKRLSLFQ